MAKRDIIDIMILIMIAVTNAELWSMCWLTPSAREWLDKQLTDCFNHDKLRLNKDYMIWFDDVSHVNIVSTLLWMPADELITVTTLGTEILCKDIRRHTNYI